MTAVAALYTPNCCATHKLYKLSFSDCVISTISTLADAMHLISENHPSKIGDDESLQRCTVGREDGGEGRAGCCCLPLLLLFSLWGLCWVSRLCLFLLSSCLHFWLLLALLLFSLNLFPFLSHPLFIPLYLVLGLSQGLNLWLWSYRNRDDNPRTPWLC